MPTVLYAYDPLNRLIQTAGIQRFYNTSRMTTEIQGAVQRSVFQVGDQLLAESRGEGCLLATDLQRSVLHRVSPSKHQSIAYNVYGHCPVENGLSSLLGFDGERADPVTGHYLLGNGYRAFNPVLMRFNSPDSWSPFGDGGINSYGYCGGNPVNKGDSNGHVAFKFVRGLLSIDDGILELKKIKYRPAHASSAKRTMSQSQEPMTIYRSLHEVMPDVYVGTDRASNGLPRLNVEGHGGYSRQERGYIISGGRKVGPAELFSALKSRSLTDQASIKLIVCYSADGTSDAMGKQLANMSGLKVKGFLGVVYSQYGVRASFQKITRVLQRTPTVADGVKVKKKLTVIRRQKDIEVAHHSLFQYGPRTFFPE